MKPIPEREMTMKETIMADNSHLMVDGVPLMRPAPPVDGKYRYQNPFSGKVAYIKDEKVAAAVELVYSFSFSDLPQRLLRYGYRERDVENIFLKMREYVRDHDVEAFYTLID
jgi:hypothetical protein